MLQIDITPFASDALEDAMRLAQVKALNSFSFSDCLSYLNYAWRDIYDRMAMIDDGYYGTNVRLTERLTRLPPFVRSTLMVYAAQSPTGHNREIFRSMDNLEMRASGMYKISGNELWCPDAERRVVWLYFVPACRQLFFTHHNRDPKLHDEHDVVRDDVYGLFRLRGAYDEEDGDGNVREVLLDIAYSGPEKHDGDKPEDATYLDGDEWEASPTFKEKLARVTRWYMVHRGTGEREDITERLVPAAPGDGENDGHWVIEYVSCDFPYIFATYAHSITGERLSGFYDRDFGWNEYNPFAFTGRNSSVEYLACRWNDKTGMGVVVRDHNDRGRIKELGWTPDSRLAYPKPEMYRYLVARLADKLSAMNESSVMAVQKELTEARFAFEAFFDRDKSAWKRIANVNPPTVGDWL